MHSGEEPVDQPRGSCMRLFAPIGALLFLAMSCLTAAAEPSPLGLNERQLVERGMPVTVIDGMKVYHSVSAKAQAAIYGKAIAEALDFHRAELGWTGDLAVAVLDADDWRELVALPYPVPHAELNWNLVVMPDSIADFPGFDLWDLDAEALNVSLTFHEIGHVIADQLKLRSDNHWIEELVADLFLAAYVRAGRGDLAAILSGVPPRFSNPGPYDQLADLDFFYAEVGLESYAWFQFRLAEAADRMLAGRRFSDVVKGLRKEFPKRQALRRETVAKTLERLERVMPGAAEMLADMAGDGVLPRLSPATCAAVSSPGSEARTEATLVVENRSAAPVRLWIEELIAEGATFQARLQHFGEDDLPRIIEDAVAAALASDESATVVRPGMVEIVTAKSGAVVDLMDGTCLAFPAETSRLIVSGAP